MYKQFVQHRAAKINRNNFCPDALLLRYRYQQYTDTKCIANSTANTRTIRSPQLHCYGIQYLKRMYSIVQYSVVCKWARYSLRCTCTICIIGMDMAGRSETMCEPKHTIHKRCTRHIVYASHLKVFASEYTCCCKVVLNLVAGSHIITVTVKVYVKIGWSASLLRQTRTSGTLLSSTLAHYIHTYVYILYTCVQRIMSSTAMYIAYINVYILRRLSDDKIRSSSSTVRVSPSLQLN